MKKTLLSWAMYALLHWNSLKAKFLTIFGDIRISKWPLFMMYQPNDYNITGLKITSILSKIQAGDIILRGYDWKYIDNLFIPSGHGYSHSGLYVGDNTIIHAVAEGVSKVNIIDFCQADKIAVVRPKGDFYKAMLKAKSYLGTPYDFSFKSGDENLYCHLTCAMCYGDIQFKKFNLSLCGITLPKIFGQCYLDKSFIDSDQCELIGEW